MKQIPYVFHKTTTLRNKCKAISISKLNLSISSGARYIPRIRYTPMTSKLTMEENFYLSRIIFPIIKEYFNTEPYNIYKIYKDIKVNNLSLMHYQLNNFDYYFTFDNGENLPLRVKKLINNNAYFM